ncbi:DNA-binding transcriptional regulator [Methylocapsa sp. S129]|uniref:helix-turn-helix domain-containing protein n=1 Tax=Methylocapsa sp. S129 TaxID=1641869 RepID=UPI00131C05E1|nr:helix-turn-helix domain-containing protein [Methylocapsa sp. S129]
MDNTEFRDWRARMGLTQQQAADMLDLSLSTIINYEKGVRRDDGNEAFIPLSVEKTCGNFERKRRAIALIEEMLPTNGVGRITARVLREVLIGLVELEIRFGDLDHKNKAKALVEQKLPTHSTGQITARALREVLIGIFELA